jgi:hypothetical protein
VYSVEYDGQALLVLYGTTSRVRSTSTSTSFLFLSLLIENKKIDGVLVVVTRTDFLSICLFKYSMSCRIGVMFSYICQDFFCNLVF